MNPDQLKAYKREKSRIFNAKMRDLRLEDKKKKRTTDQQPDNQSNLQGNNQSNQPDELTLQDLMDIYETLDTKMDIIQNKLETIIENKLENKLENNQPINRQPSIFFA